MSHRRERISRDLHSRIAEIIDQRVRDPRLESVTVVEVRVSPDLSIARVFYRTLGEPDDVERALDKAMPFIRRCVAEGLTLRRVPALDFRRDVSSERAARVDEILEELREQRGHRSIGGGDEEQGEESA